MAHVRDQWFKTAADGRRVKTARHGNRPTVAGVVPGLGGRRHAKSFDKEVDAERGSR